MNEAPVVRRLKADDVAIWKDIREAALTLAPQSFGSTLARFHSQNDADHVNKLAGSAVFGAFIDDQIVGSAGWHAIDFPTEHHRGHVTSFFVMPKLQGRGTADALMDRIFDNAQRCVLQLELDVAVTNTRAIAFYNRHGFAFVGTIPRALCHDGVFTDEHIMLRNLDA